jgi:hypothetical protein
MVRKIRVGLKKVNRSQNNIPIVTDTDEEIKPDVENEIPDTPTCIRCYIKNEKDIQKLNGMMLRFNVGKVHLVLQRVGYKMDNEKMSEIDIAALHDPDYSVNSTEYAIINRYLTAFMKENDISFKFINFDESYKNSAGCHIAIDGMSTLGEYITIEKGSVTNELFSYIQNKLNIPVDIVSISLPISDNSGIFVTYHTEWVKGTVEDNNVMEEDNKSAHQKDNPSNSINVSIFAYTEKASESLDLVISQFQSAIGRSMYDYTEKKHDGYFRVIRMNVTMNETGKRLIDSLEWIDNILINKEEKERI